jgi:hypothetical protein
MDQNKPIIVEAKEVLRLAKFRTLWMLGWMVATAALVVAAIQTVRVLEHDRQVEDLRVLREDIERVQAEQKTINDTYTKAWQNQQQTADLLISWGTYVKERADLGTHNIRNGSLNLVRR